MTASPGERVALVTGAGSGIGRAVAVGLCGEGYAVIAAGRRPAQLEETVRLGTGRRGRLIAMPCDVSLPSEVAALFARVGDELGRLDLLFNNAGQTGPAAAFEDVTVEQWRSVVDVNLTGAFLCAQAAFRIMQHQDPRGGRIINNGSVSAQAPRPRAAAYTATKHAITGLTKSISLEGRPFDIACGQIDIGNAATEMTDGIAHGALQPAGDIRPEPRIALEHVVRAVLYMASLPLGANVQSMTVMATAMPLVGRG